MLKVFIFNLVFLFLLVYKTDAQEIKYTGKIVNKDGHSPVENCNISVYKGANIAYRTVSDSLGFFKIPVAALMTSDSNKLHALNYQDLSVDKGTYNSIIKNNSFFLGTFELSPKTIKLREVKVKSNKRYRDTTKIDLSKETFERSVMIDDLFSKYGLSKDASGQLFYKGKPVTDIEVNGDTFFGKNNMDIYHLLPALVLTNINVVETNIDSTTNTTMLRPDIKVNLVLKEKFKSGKFGNANLAAGTVQRYLANTNLFAYKNREQVSLFLNSNNINTGDNTILEPTVDFSPNGNNLTTQSARFSYRNVFANKLEVNLSVKGKLDNKTFTSLSDIQEQNENLFSRSFTSSATKSFAINDTRLTINYKIDSLNTINAIQTFDHLHVNESDSSNYNITFDSFNTASQLNKLRNTNSNLLSTKVTFQKKFNSKKGRLLSVGLEFNDNNYNTGEFNNVGNTLNQTISNYFINGNHSAIEHKYSLNSSFTEPLSDDVYLNFFVGYESGTANYNTHVNSDTVISSSDAPSQFKNDYFRTGFKFQKTMDKISFNAITTGIFDQRNTHQLQYNKRELFFNDNFDLSIDYKLTPKKSVNFDISGITNYPTLQQLTDLNSTFTVISQLEGNIFLTPEEKQSIKASYSLRPSDSENIYFSVELNRFVNKFGFEINNTPNNLGENIVMANIGNSKGGQISFSFLKNISNTNYLNYTSGIAYQESPTVANNSLILNNGITFNQSISTSIAVIKPLVSITPQLSTSFSEFFFPTRNYSITTFIYSDKLSLNTSAFRLDLYPLFDFNHSITNVSSFSMNGAIRKSIFKDYADVWFQAYDIFNSFKYVNNFLGAASYQSVKYSNLQRYILLGISFKFNNMK